MKLALGTVQFGMNYGIANQTGKVSHSEAKSIMKLALDNGINMIDTAISYGDSESCLGDMDLQGFKLITKLPELPDHCPNINTWVQDQIQRSFSRLGLTKIYGLLIHKPEQLLSLNGSALYKAMQELKYKGQVEKIGISIYSPAELSNLKAQYNFDLVQAPFNLIDRRLHNTGWLKRLKDDGIEIHTRSAFLQGLLLMPQSDIPSKFMSWTDLWTTWHCWLRDHNISALQACLAFPLSFQEIDRVVVGVDNMTQMTEILSEVKCKLVNNLPDLKCDHENLINPQKWPTL